MAGEFHNGFSHTEVNMPETQKVSEAQGKWEAPSLENLKSKLQNIFDAEPNRKLDAKPEMAAETSFAKQEDSVTLDDGTVVKLPGTSSDAGHLEGFAENLHGESGEGENRPEGLTNEQKEQIKKETGWSDEIIDAIGSMEEYEIYKKAGLVEAEIDGKKCLVRNDIDWEQKDRVGRTNRERAEQGLSPINKDGKVIELHHIGQHADSPLAELTPEEHRGRGNDSILHDKTKESEIDRQVFASERSEHWAARAGQ